MRLPAAILALAGLTGIAGYWLAGRKIWTDDRVIRMPDSHATPRDVLWAAPAPLPQPVNTWQDDYGSGATADGATLFFVRGSPGIDQSGADVYVSSRRGDAWTDPEPLTVVNSDSGDLSPRPTRDGRFLYASNRGHDSLAIYAVSDDGSLTAIGHQPTEATPRFFDLDPTGTYILAVGQNSGRMATYRINHEDGSLDPLASFKVGDSPLWIQFVPKE